MSLRKLFSNVPLMIRLQSIIGRRSFASKSPSDIIESAEEVPKYLETEEEFEKKRNKSRLNPEHRNILFDQKPFEDSVTWYHNTVRYKKRILGKYGIEALGVPAGVAWPTPEEVEDAKEYERVAFPLTLQERWQKIKGENRKKEEDIIAWQEKIAAKMAKMGDFKAELEAKVQKKAAELQIAKKKKESRLKQIKLSMAGKGTITSANINELMTKMDKEEKKKKKALRQQRIIERQKRLLSKNMPIQTNDKSNADVDAETATDETPISSGTSLEIDEPMK